MPRDLFGSASAFDGVGTRQRYALPLAVLTHVFVIATLVVVPLVVTGAWPLPGSVLVFAARLPDPPAPELPAPASAQPVTTVDLNPNAAPPAPSDRLAPETALLGPPSLGPLVGVDAVATAPSAGAVALASPPPVSPVAPEQPPRVGGAIGEPRKVHDVLPAYPAIARAARAEGTVILDAVIARDGSVREVTVLRSVPLLDDAAIAAVKQWRYTPTTLNGVAIDVRMTVTVRFSLRP